MRLYREYDRNCREIPTRMENQREDQWTLGLDRGHMKKMVGVSMFGAF